MANKKPWDACSPKDLPETNYDVLITADIQTFKVFGKVICSGSPILTARLQSARQVGQARQISIDGFHAATVTRFLEYQYSGKYQSSPLATDPKLNFNCTEGNRVLLLHLRVAAMADYFQVNELKNVALRNFEDGSKAWSLDGFGRVAIAAYAIPVPGERALKDIICAATHRYWHIFGASTELELAMRSCGQFAFDVYKAREIALKIEQERKEQEVKNIKIKQEIKQEQMDQESKQALVARLAAEQAEQEENARLRDKLAECVRERDMWLDSNRSNETEVTLLKKKLNPPEKSLRDLTSGEEDLKAFKKVLGLCEKAGRPCCGVSWPNQMGKRGKGTAGPGTGWVVRCIRCSQTFAIYSIREHTLKIFKANGEPGFLGTGAASPSAATRSADQSTNSAPKRSISFFSQQSSYSYGDLLSDSE